MEGILVTDKPQGLTSHDMVDFVRRRFQIKKVGHTGTLDPMATGVLVLLLGRFTKRSAEFIAHDKEYLATLALGVATDTYDAQGTITKRQAPGKLSRARIEEVFSQFVGEIEQVPPMFSALKHRGSRCYTLARKGIAVARQMRKVHIYQLQITKVELPNIFFSVSCSKGTYIRSLCVDIATNLNSPGHLLHLRRISCGPFLINQAVNLRQLEQFSPQELSGHLQGL